MAEVMLTEDNFEAEVLKSDIPELVDFWAPWCGPCQQMGPVVEALAGELEGKVKVAKMNVDENQTTPGKYGVMSIPAFMIFKGGEVVDQTVGGMSGEKLKEFAEKNA